MYGVSLHGLLDLFFCLVVNALRVVIAANLTDLLDKINR